MTSHCGLVHTRPWAGGVLVLCPYGHGITSWRPGQGEWAGSALEARITAGDWVVDCDGALPNPSSSSVFACAETGPGSSENTHPKE